MLVDYDAKAREVTLKHTGLDFEDIRQQFVGFHIHFLHNREDEGSDSEGDRYTTVGYVDNDLVATVWSPRGKAKFVLAMRLAHDEERELFRYELDQSG